MAVVIVGVLVVTATIGTIALGPTNGGADSVAAGAFPDRVHAAGVTGENVTVGVIDATGFDTDRPRLSRAVAATAAFRTAGGAELVGRVGHGTATAVTVARIAPDAELYLATVDSAAAFVNAVSWLREQDVDVIVAPVTFLGRPGTGRSPVARAAARAVADGIVFVAPTGNVRGGHWEGTYAPVKDGTLGFAGGARNPLVGEQAGDRLRVWLSWDRRHADQNFTLELYRADGRGGELVARSRPVGDRVPNARLDAELGPGEYFLTIRGPDEPGDARLELVSPTHEFQYGQANGSVLPPAVGRGVLGVGGLDPRDGQVEPFSARGPSRDGRRAVDLVAPDRLTSRATEGPFVGSSAAAAYTAGVVALLLDAGAQSPRAIQRRLARTASDVGPPGPDRLAGYGRVDPIAAVRAARNRTGR